MLPPLRDAVEDRFGPWFVQWRPEGFSIRDAGPHFDFFRFSRIILPVKIVSSRYFARLDRILLTVEPPARVEILLGAPKDRLESFKKRVSAAVVAARQSPFGCADCASEAGHKPSMWDGTVCGSCHEYYCRNPKCLCRLQVDVLRDGSRVCRLCGVENGHAGAEADFERRSLVNLAPIVRRLAAVPTC